MSTPAATGYDVFISHASEGKRRFVDALDVALRERGATCWYAAGRPHDRLVDAYGHERVFMDVDSAPLGIDFVEHVSERMSRCSAVMS